MLSTTCSACTWDCRVGVLSVAHGLVRYLLRNVLQLSVGTAGLLLAATIHAEAVIDHIDGALHDETGTYC